jgi:hypothetical protein
MTFEEIKEQALTLDLNARAALAHALLRSLDDLSESEAERLWLEEAERRQREVHEGRVQMVPGDEVMRRLQKALG